MPDENEEKKGPLAQLADLVFYAPLGFWMNVEEIVPQLIEKGRQQVNMARMFGQFAVQKGQEQASKTVSQLSQQAGTVAGRVANQVTRDGDTAGASGGAPEGSATADEAAASNGARIAAAAPPVETLAIPDYESLSASQVVPRLEGLSATELDAVEGYENAHRGRKTILNKIAQLRS